MDATARLAFEEIALPHLDSLYGVALRLTREPAAAEDLVQDTMVRAYRFWHRFEPGTNVRAWLFTILRNTFVSRYHHDHREREKASDLAAQLSSLGPAEAPVVSASAFPAPDSAVEAKFTAERVHAALASVPEDFRLAVTLADIEGMSYKEIAAIMGCPIGTVMSRLYRGRRHLSRALGAEVAASAGDKERADAAPLSLEAYRKRGQA